MDPPAAASNDAQPHPAEKKKKHVSLNAPFPFDTTTPTSTEPNDAHTDAHNDAPNPEVEKIKVLSLPPYSIFLILFYYCALFLIRFPASDRRSRAYRSRLLICLSRYSHRILIDLEYGQV